MNRLSDLYNPKALTETFCSLNALSVVSATKREGEGQDTTSSCRAPLTWNVKQSIRLYQNHIPMAYGFCASSVTADAPVVRVKSA